MWCGASTSTWIHETVRHTWRFDFDSSNSVSVAFVIFCLKYVEQKESLFGLVFCLFVPANLAQHFSGALCCFLFSVLFLFSFPWCRLFHLASDLAHFRVQFRSRFTVHHPSPHRHTHIHTFPQSDTLPSQQPCKHAHCCFLPTRAKGGYPLACVAYGFRCRRCWV